MRISFNVRLRLSGYNIKRFLNLCAVAGIKLWDVEILDEKRNVVFVSLRAKDVFGLSSIIKKTHTRIKVIERTGLFKAKHFFKVTAAIWIILVLFAAGGVFYSSRLWNVQVSGNDVVSYESIGSFLTEKNIYKGCSKRLDYKKLGQDLVKEYDDIIWCAIYADGVTLKIEIAEERNCE